MNQEINSLVHVVPSTASLNETKIIDEIIDSLSDVSEWISEAQEYEKLALCIWDGQSADGRKWKENYNKKVFPFNGAADSRVHLIASAIDEVVRIEMAAAESATVQVIAMEETDAAASKKVETLMKYEVRQRLRNELWRERNFARQIKHTFGHAVMHVGWEESMGTAKAKLTIEDLVKIHTEALLATARQSAADAGAQPDESGEVLTPEEKMFIADNAEIELQNMLMATEPDAVAGLVKQAHPMLSNARVNRVVRMLKKDGEAEFPSPYKKAGKPSVRSFVPGIDIFYPWWTCPIARAPWVARIDSYSEPELMAKPKTANWNQAAVDAMIEMGPQKVIETDVVLQQVAAVSQKMFNEPARLSFTQKYASRERLQYEVLHITVNTVDEEGYPAVHEIILHPALAGKNARENGKEMILFTDLVDYYFEGGCYVEMRREFKSRPLFDSRGIPELTSTHQWLLKSTRDASMDRTSFATMPIVKVNSRRAGEAKRWDYEPGTKLPLSQGDDAQYMQPPRLDQGTILDAEEIRLDVARLLGLHHEGIPKEQTLAHQQWMATNALLEEREIMLKILAMDQQYMSPLSVSRVLGNGPLPFQVTRDEIAGSYDFVLEFDVRSLDMEYLEKRWKAIKEAFSIPGVAGQIPTIPVVSWLLNNVDATLADMVVGGLSERNAAEAELEKNAISMILNGIEPQVTESMDANIRLQTIQEQMQMNPVVSNAYSQNPTVMAMIDARVQAFQFAIEQKTTNAEVGRTGFKPVMEQQTEV